jgi:D-arabinose 1-dehydrogenase-like Zn-dependent alcohol dehydrogenase
MDLVTDGALRLGDFFLRARTEDRPDPKDLLIDLAPAPQRCAEWLQAGALLGVQALAPLTDLPTRMRSRLGFLGAGAGSALPALAALRLGFGVVDLVGHPEDEEPFAKLAAAVGADGKWTLHRRVDDVHDGAFHHWALIGCDGTVPSSWEAFGPFVRRLRPEGQMVFFGLPMAAIEEVHQEAARRGYALRSFGVRGALAAVGGSLEHHHRFA